MKIRRKLILIVVLVAFSSLVMTCTTGTSAKDPSAGRTPGLLESLLAGTDGTIQNEEVLLSMPFNQAAMSFQLNLLKAAAEGERNAFLSPLSAGIALTMAANGAGGTTLEEFENVLGMNLQEMNIFYSAVQQRLNRGDGQKVLNSANSMFIDKERITVSENYIRDTGRYFSAGLYNLNFSSRSAVRSINDWANFHSNGMITRVIDKIDSAQIMFLANAVSFEGKWMDKFDKKENYTGSFAAPSGNVRTVFMKKYLKCSYYFNNDCAIAMLPYEDGEYFFTAIMPESDFNAWFEAFTAKDYFELIEKAVRGDFTIGLPKFEAKFSYDLKEPLRKMGLNAAFADSFADFKKLGTSNAVIFLFDVPHKTYIKVNEEGTSAAAVTVPSFGARSAVRSSIIFDKPFLYTIFENKTGLPVFTGIMKNPAAK